MTTADSKRVIQRYYDELWNSWDLSVADEILDPAIRFRGSMGIEVKGLAAFKDYLGLVQGALPDFKNKIEDLIAEGDQVVARMTYRGTHLGELLGFAPTGRVVTYPGVAIFRLAGGKIVEGWVIGDTHTLRKQLSGS